ncbi:putative hydrolase of the HAD superfamily [Pullulanibacillus pueri]|uniref:HAD family hydrolase n=1 Tax=Pullulanibacillus pueri TaxID=1437324 RepID=A0A8J2ZTM0_9BACL|nr:HAD-IA family hydrolase [Pullulanibacillus pueri]MBM7681028.1 putative hydrolase of the HAD superfamily [Pullulanibacillus pueri]GGH76757.1 hypothetical protein GCM10007096_07640 [Pullulanibacillus pueri]
MIQAIFFDLYETLITEWEDGKKRTSYSVDTLGLDRHTYKKEWTARRDKRMDGSYLDHRMVLKEILKAAGRLIDETIIEDIHQKRIQAKSIPFQKIDEEILITLQILKQRKIKLGLISNCAPEEVYSWNNCLLADIFDDVVFSYEVKQRKPQPDIYYTACGHLKVAPNECIFIGDGGSNELQGASDVGMKAYHATWYQPPFISEKMTGFPKLESPTQILQLIASMES